MNLPYETVIITDVTSSHIAFDFASGSSAIVPRFYGEPPKPGDVMLVDVSNGTPIFHPMPPLATIESARFFMNFGKISSASYAQENSQIDGKPSESMALMTPLGFADLPVGSETIMAPNGNVVYASDGSVGMAVSNLGRLSFFDGGKCELIAKNFVSLTGNKAIASNFEHGYHFEIELMPTHSKSVGKLEELKQAVAELMIEGASSKDGKNKTPLQYDEALREVAKGSDAAALIEVFGLGVADVLLSFKISKIRFIGNMKVFQEVMSAGGGDVLISIVGYVSEGVIDNIREIEIYLTPGSFSYMEGSAPVPPCSGANPNLYSPNGTWAGEEYTISYGKIIESNGRIVTFTKDSIEYAMQHGVVAKKNWVAAEQNQLSATESVLDVASLGIHSLNFSGGASDICGVPVALPGSVTWDGQFKFFATGDITMITSGTMAIAGQDSYVYGGSKGLHVSSSGTETVSV